MPVNVGLTRAPVLRLSHV